MAYVMEVCVDSVESAVNAERGGAARVELCSNLMEGGTTPSLGMLRVVKREVKIPVFVMIRPRGGDFLYSESEYQVMSEDLKVLKENGADGVVFGILTPDGGIDMLRSRDLIALARPLPVTFHRAFDMVQDPFQSLEDLMELGVDRVLTSGHDSSALEGLPVLESLVEQAQGEIRVVPGGGVNERNVKRILEGSGAKEFHCSARRARESVMKYCNTGVSMGAKLGPPEFSVSVAAEERVRNLVAAAQEVLSS
jgi:copper homeostasis protein